MKQPWCCCLVIFQYFQRGFELLEMIIRKTVHRELRSKPPALSPSKCHPHHLLRHLGSNKIQGSYHCSFSTSFYKISKRRCIIKGIIKYFCSLIASSVSCSLHLRHMLQWRPSWCIEGLDDTRFLIQWWSPEHEGVFVLKSNESAVHHRLHSFKRALSDRLKDHWMEEIPPYRYPPENSYVPQNRDHFKRTFHLNQPSIFRGYASFQEVYRSKKPSLDCTLPINCLCYPPESASEEIQRPAQDVQMRPLTKKNITWFIIGFRIPIWRCFCEVCWRQQTWTSTHPKKIQEQKIQQGQQGNHTINFQANHPCHKWIMRSFPSWKWTHWPNIGDVLAFPLARMISKRS